MNLQVAVEALAGILGVLVPALVTIITLIFKHLTKYKSEFAKSIAKLKDQVMVLQAENYKLQNRVTFLEEENKQLRQENLKLKKGT